MSDFSKLSLEEERPNNPNIENDKAISGEVDESDDENDDELEDGNIQSAEKKKKKKKKKSNKKKPKAVATNQEPSLLPQSRLLSGYTDYYIKYGQTLEPSIPVAVLFKDNNFPEGEILPHGETKIKDVTCTSNKRITDEEKRYNERIQFGDLLNKVRHASEVHRQVRHYAQSFIKPGENNIKQQ